MKKKSSLYQTCFIVCCLFIIFVAGIIRHDVSLKKYEKFTHKKDFGCVGILFAKNDNHHGSCVLIGERFVLTAAHLDLAKDANGNLHNYYCVFGNKKYEIKKVMKYPEYDRSAKKYIGDLELLELTEKVSGITPAELYDKDDELNKKVAIVGSGHFGVGNIFGSKKIIPPRNLGGMNVIDSIGGKPSQLNNLKTLLFIDFDHPQKIADCNPLGNPKPLPLEFIPEGGDSGGGLFIRDKGKWKLGGTMAFKTNYNSKRGNYGEICSFTRTLPFRRWIIDQMAAE